MLNKEQKVLGIGLSKTGTASLARALNLLSIKTIHCPADQTTFDELKNGNYKLSILNKFQGAVDTPIVPFYAQLDKTFPDSKFILTVRQIDSWINSMRRHMSFLSRWTEDSLTFFAFIDACVYGTLEFHEDRLRYVYETHVRNVNHYFSNRPEDLLILNICDGEGWEKLCPFLGLPVPSIPFPKANRSRGDDSEWTAQNLDSAIQRLQDVLPKGVQFALAGYNRLFLKIPAAVPFIQKDGVDIGVPRNDQVAIEQIQNLRQMGARYVVFLFPSFWWLDHYTEFHRYLNSNFPITIKDDQVVIFQLN